jgi:hypothetical protein
MFLLFLDESGQLSERKLFALGGIALRDSDWHALRDLWQATLAAHGWPADREVKWHGIRKGEVPPALADAVVSTLAHAPLTCYVTLLDQELGLEAAPSSSRPRRTRTRPGSCSWPSASSTSSSPRTRWGSSSSTAASARRTLACAASSPT